MITKPCELARIKARARRPFAAAVCAVIGVTVSAAPPSQQAQPGPSPVPTSIVQTDSLRVRAGDVVPLRLALPNGERWETANVGYFVVRSPEHVPEGMIEMQRAVDASAARDGVLEYTFREPGDAMVILSAGPAETRGLKNASDLATYCTKLFIRVDPAADAKDAPAFRFDAAETLKVGQKIELRPLMMPSRLYAGSDFAVIAYFDQAKQSGVEVRAFKPDGVVVSAMTDASGSAHFKIDQTGRWVVRYERATEQRNYIGELVFDVRDAQPELDGGAK